MILRHDALLDTFLEQYDELVNLIKINHGEPPRKTAQPQELHGTGLG